MPNRYLTSFTITNFDDLNLHETIIGEHDSPGDPKIEWSDSNIQTASTGDKNRCRCSAPDYTSGFSICQAGPPCDSS